MRYAQIVLALSITTILMAGVASARGTARREASAAVLNANGAEIGTVTLAENDGRVGIHAVLSSLPPGFHGFHIHSVGQCVDSFTSAGAHLNPQGSHSHPVHAGDMPSLLVNTDGTAELWFVTDRLTMADLVDADGSAVIVHADPDNYGNIPTRYAPQPDDTTLATGDAGGRIACGVIS
jgi:superoxide dismutase, Cu-Zn family